MLIVMFLTTSDIMRPDQDSCFSLAPVQSVLPWIQLSGAPLVDSVAFYPAGTPTLLRGTTDGRQI